MSIDKTQSVEISLLHSMAEDDKDNDILISNHYCHLKLS